jgi:hypothetical protein
MNKEWLGNNKKAALFLRRSGAGQEDNTSEKTQDREGRKYCAEAGLDIIFVTAIIESAKTSELRKKYNEMIQRARREGVRHIIFHRFDRESRNLTDNENNENLVREDEFVLHYVADQKVLHKNSPDTDFLMRDYHAVQNKHYSRDLSTKVRRATKEKASSGWFPGCVPPLGYMNQKLKRDNGFEQRRGTIIVPGPDTISIKIVQREYELRLPAEDGSIMSLQQIRKAIISEGLIPPSRINKYHAGSIERRLKNKFYDCRFDWGGVEYQGRHERIIPAETFWAVQETFGIKNPYRKSNGVFDGGWLRCALPNCGCNIVFDPKTKTLVGTGEKVTYRYYHCTNGKRKHETMKGLSVLEDKLWDQFGNAVSSVSITEDFAMQLSEAMNETQRKAQTAVMREIEGYQEAINMLDSKSDRLFDKYDAGEFTREDYDRQKNRIRSERDHYTKLLGQANVMINDAACETAKSILELATNAESLWKMQSPQERKTLLDRILSNRALDGVTVRYELKKPFCTLSEMKTDQNWRRE